LISYFEKKGCSLVIKPYSLSDEPKLVRVLGPSLTNQIGVYRTMRLPNNEPVPRFRNAICTF